MLWILTPHFLTVSNLLNIAEQTSINAIVAVGMTFVILSGGIDLSVGSIVALSGVVLGTALQGGQPMPVALLLALAVGLACGLGNGALISWGGLPPFIVTLGTMSIARGAALLFTEGRPVSGFDASFRVLATGRVGFVPAPVIAMVARLPGRAFRADPDDVRALRLRDRRERGGDAPVGRADPLPQDDDLRRVRADERRRRPSS